MFGHSKKCEDETFLRKTTYWAELVVLQVRSHIVENIIYMDGIYILQ